MSHHAQPSLPAASFSFGFDVPVLMCRANLSTALLLQAHHGGYLCFGARRECGAHAPKPESLSAAFSIWNQVRVRGVRPRLPEAYE